MINKYPSIIFLLWFFVLVMIFYAGFLYFPKTENGSDVFLNNFANWDGKHYLAIVEFGYFKDEYFAFFPGYPLAVRVINILLNNFLISALIVSIASSFFAVNLLYRLVNLEFNRKIASKTVELLLFFPTSFYLVMSYSEGLFFMLSLASFYLFKRKKYIWASIFTSLAGATRPMGIALVIIHIFYVLKNVNRKKARFCILIAPLGFLCYMLFVFSKTGDPFYFIWAQSHWDRVFALPWNGFVGTVAALTLPEYRQSFNLFFELIFAIFGIGLALRSCRFLPAHYCFYGLLSVVIPLFTATLMSVPRFLLVVFPIFIVLAKINNPYWNFFYRIVSIMLLSIFATVFINGYWVS